MFFAFDERGTRDSCQASFELGTPRETSAGLRPEGSAGSMRIVRRFVWSNGRPDDHDVVVSASVANRVTHEGVAFVLRHWDIRYRPAERRINEAIYNEMDGHRPGQGSPAPDEVDSEYTEIAPPLALSRTRADAPG